MAEYEAKLGSDAREDCAPAGATIGSRRRKQYEGCGLKHTVLGSVPLCVAAYRCDDMLERWRSFFLDSFKY